MSEAFQNKTATIKSAKATLVHGCKNASDDVHYSKQGDSGNEDESEPKSKVDPSNNMKKQCIENKKESTVYVSSNNGTQSSQDSGFGTDPTFEAELLKIDLDFQNNDSQKKGCNKVNKDHNENHNKANKNKFHHCEVSKKQKVDEFQNKSVTSAIVTPSKNVKDNSIYNTVLDGDNLWLHNNILKLEAKLEQKGVQLSAKGQRLRQQINFGKMCFYNSFHDRQSCSRKADILKSNKAAHNPYKNEHKLLKDTEATLLRYNEIVERNCSDLNNYLSEYYHFLNGFDEG